MSGSPIKGAQLIVRAKRFRKWIFGLSAKRLLAVLIAQFFGLIISKTGAPESEASNVFAKLLICTVMLYIAGAGLGLLCDSLIEISKKGGSFVVASLLFLMGMSGLSFATWQIYLAVSRQTQFGSSPRPATPRFQ
jgi:hypothetical protein